MIERLSSGIFFFTVCFGMFEINNNEQQCKVLVPQKNYFSNVERIRNVLYISKFLTFMEMLFGICFLP